MPGVAGSCRLGCKSRAAGWDDRWTVAGVCVFLATIVWVVFGQTLRHEFVGFDDDLYVHENPVVQKGLTWDGLRWALTYGKIGHWHPLTWLSHMLDCQLYGLQAGGHHLTNVLLHAATAILLFLVLRQMTGFPWRSAFVAAVFAVHPLRAESVAWIAERKDVLSGFFFMLTLWAYTRYAQGVARTPTSDRAPGVARLTFHVSRFYCLVLLFFALGLLSKNMLMTMPFVLLLLDYWPLDRLSSFTPRVWFRLAAEKIPLFVLMVGSCVATALVPEKLTYGRMPFGLRMENAAVSYVTYLWQMLYPSGLACLYPNPTNYLPLWEVTGAVGLLLALSGAAWVFRRTHPWLVVGWLWYLGMMIPVIGVVQISSYAAHADRYTYLPQIGLYLLLTWTAAELCAGWRHRCLMLGGLSTVILAALMFCARIQTTYWRNAESLWIHTLACTSDNVVAHNNLGNVLLQKGEVDEAIVQFKKSLEIKPDYVEACYNLGTALLQSGRVDEAINFFQTALQIKPDHVEARINLGIALFQEGRADEAVNLFQTALQIKPDDAEVRINLGTALLQQNKVDEAIAQYQAALKIKPGHAEACYYLGNALLQQGRAGEAVTQYQKALEIKPGYPEALNNLAWLLAASPQTSLRNGSKAVELAQRANQLSGGENLTVLHTLAVAYAEAGRFGDAIRSIQKAVELAQAAGQNDLARQFNGELKLFEAGLPFHMESN